MEKNYAERVMEIKNEILKEIREILPDGETHKFENTFYVHYVSGEVATTEVCIAVINNYGSVGFNVAPEDVLADVTDNFVDGEDIFNFEPNSFMDVLENLRKELREKKLAKLREIVQTVGGEISFTGDFSFDGFLSGEYIENCYLKSLKISDGKIIVNDIFEGSNYKNNEDFLPSDELDKIIKYVEKKTASQIFALTTEQNLIVDEFIVAVRKLAQAKVSILRDNATDKLHFINGEKIDEIFIGEEVEKAVDITDAVNKSVSLLPIIDRAFYSCDNEKIFVTLHD